LIHQMAN